MKASQRLSDHTNQRVEPLETRRPRKKKKKERKKKKKGEEKKSQRARMQMEWRKGLVHRE